MIRAAHDAGRLTPTPMFRILAAAGLVGLALAAPASRAGLFSGAYEGTVTEEDGEFVASELARAVITQVGPLLTIEILHDFGEGFTSRFTFEAAASGNSFAIEVSRFEDWTGTVAGGSLQIVRTVQGTPLIVDTYNLTCIADCPEPEPEPEPDDGPCPDAPPPLEWVGEATGEFGDAENWDEERAPGPDDRVFLDESAVDASGELTLNVLDNMVIDVLDVTDVEVVLRSGASLPTELLLLGVCDTPLAVLSTQTAGKLTVEDSLAVDADTVSVVGTGGQRARLFVLDDAELTTGRIAFFNGDGLLAGRALLEASTVELFERSAVTVAGIDAASVLRIKQDGELLVADDSQFTVSDGGQAVLPGSVKIDVAGDRRGFLVERQGSRCSAGIGFLQNGRLVVIDRAEATFNTLAVGVIIRLDNPTADGKVFVVQATLKVEEFLSIGVDGKGLLEATDGIVETPALSVGGVAGGEIGLHGPGSSLRVSDHAIVGGVELGAISLDTGAFMETQRLTIGQESGEQGAVRVDGVSSTVTVAGLSVIGESGEGSISVADRGSVFANGVCTIAAQPGSIGAVDVGGGSVAVRPVWEIQEVLNIGFAGKGDLFIHNFGEVRGADAVMGVTETGNGLIDIQTNGRLILTGELRVGDQGIGTLQLDPTARVSATVVGITSNSSFNGTLIQIGGAAAPQGINLGAPKRRHAAQEQEEQDVAPGLYTRALMIEEGATIEADSVRLEEGGTLGGTGQLGLDIENRGRLSPGADDCSVGALTVAGDYTQPADGVLEITIAGEASDRAAVAGAATLGGTLEIILRDNETSPVGRTFEVLTAASVSGTFDNVVDSDRFRVEYGPASVKVTVLSAQSADFVDCSGLETPVLCGEGLCGAGLFPALPFLTLSLAGGKWRTAARRRRRGGRQVRATPLK